MKMAKDQIKALARVLAPVFALLGGWFLGTDALDPDTSIAIATIVANFVAVAATIISGSHDGKKIDTLSEFGSPTCSS